MRLLPMFESQAGQAVPEAARMGYRDAQVSPCATCATSPCCTYLPLHTFKITTMLELDHAVYLLNFDRIELGMSASGDWSVYYRFPCRFLDRQTFGCTVHDTPRQPNICVHYNPYGCWYKRVLTPTVSDEFLRVDRQRMQFIIDHVVFDESRTIVEVPTWETLAEQFSRLPAQPNGEFDVAPTDDPVFMAWERQALTGEPADAPLEEFAFAADVLRTPCASCQAYCCTTLVFPHPIPASMSNLDYFQFSLGFPGIELGITDDSWSIVVKTKCRHLDGHRCGVYGQPERPLLCKYYDEWKCTYRVEFGVTRPPGFMRVRLEQFAWLAECFGFDQYGAIVRRPSTEELREHIEAQRRLAGSAPITVQHGAEAVQGGRP